MSLFAAFDKLKEVLNDNKPPAHYDAGPWPDVVLGIITNAYQGPSPAWYLQWPKEHRSYVGLRSSTVDNTSAETALYFVVSRDQMPSGVDDFGEYMYNHLALPIIQAIEAAVGDRTFEDDGDRGSDVHVSDVEIDHSPDQVLGYVKLTISIAQYS